MRLLIVDDERIILKWLKKNIEMLFPDYQIVALCVNGKQAFNICLEQEIDVLITDIRMPFMDGTELIRRLKDNDILPYTIVLSAYDDFSYVRDAFKIGAKEFLLKPEITEEGLRECLTLAETRLHAGKQKQGLSQRTPLQQEIYACLTEKLEVDPARLKELFLKYSDIKGAQITVVMLENCGNNTMDQIMNILRFIYSEQLLVYITISFTPSCCLVISEAVLKPHILAERLENAFSSFGFKTLRIGVSEVMPVESIPSLYQQVQECLEVEAYYDEFTCMVYGEWKKNRTEEQFKGPSERLKETIHDNSYDGIRTEFLSLLDLIGELRPSPAQVRRIVLEPLLKLYWDKVRTDDNMQISSDNLVMLCSVKRFAELRENLMNQLEQMLQLSQKTLSEQGYSAPVCQIFQFIKEHFDEDISLDDLAAHVHFNRSYISSLFKKETGENIFDYLLGYRLNKAKELLINRELSIKQVCNAVGITDQAYFSKVFKKHFRCTPNEFRKNPNETQKDGNKIQN